MKPFYRDSLLDLRRVLYLVLQRVLRTSPFYPSIPAPELRKSEKPKTEIFRNNFNFFPSWDGVNNNSVDGKSGNSNGYPRVVIVTRNLTTKGTVNMIL